MFIGLGEVIRLQAWYEARLAHRDAADRLIRHLKSCSFCSPSAGAGCEAGRLLDGRMTTAAHAHADVHAAAFDHAIGDAPCCAVGYPQDASAVFLLRPPGADLARRGAALPATPLREEAADGR